MAKAKKAGGKLSASDFIRAQPESMKAREVAEKAAAAGYSFKAGLVYAVRRAQAKKLFGGGRGGAGHAAHLENSHEFRRLMLRLGLDQSEAIYNQVHKELRAIEEGE